MIKTLQQYQILSIFIVSIHLVYFFTALYFGGIYTIDSPGYLFQAQNLVQYHSVYAGNYHIPLLADYFAFRPPFYGYFIVFCHFFYSSDYSVLFTQNLISIGLIFYVLHFVNQLGVKSKVIKLIFPICLLFYPAHFVYTNTIMSDSIFEALIFALFYQTYLCFNKPTIGKILIISLIIAVSMITKPVSILIGLLVCVVLLFAKNYPKIYLLPVIILPLFSYFSFGYAVKKETGYFQFTSMKSFVAVRCLVKYSAANAYGVDYSDSISSAIVTQADLQPSLQARFNYIDSSCNAFLLDHKMAFFKVYLKGCLTFMFDPGRYDLYKLFNANNDNALGMYQTLQQYGVKAMLKFLFGINLMGLVALAILALWNVCVVVIFILFLVKTNTSFILKLLVALFVLYFVATTGVLGVSRYRVHVFPILITTILVWANQFSYFKKYFHD